MTAALIPTRDALTTPTDRLLARTVVDAVQCYGAESIHVTRDTADALVVAWGEAQEAWDEWMRPGDPNTDERRAALRVEAAQACAAFRRVVDLLGPDEPDPAS